MPPWSYNACSAAATSDEAEAVVPDSVDELLPLPQPAAAIAIAATATGNPIRPRLARLSVALGVVLLMVAIVPAALGAAADSPNEAGLPDLWSGTWPAALMNADGSETPLGTLTWKPIRYEDGAAIVGQNFGGLPFLGCPADGRTRFFRGHYMEGGDLIGCTRGEDTKELVGRFNGREDFRSGSFVVQMISADEFEGRYDEDGGITTQWCGELKERLFSAAGQGEALDINSPTLFFQVPAKVKVGAPLRLRLGARDDSQAARVDVSVLKGAKALTRMNGIAVRPDGTVKVVTWRVPRSARGSLRACAAAFDRAGNSSSRKCVRLTVA